MATTTIVPFRRAPKDVIEVLLADHAKAVEHLVLERRAKYAMPVSFTARTIMVYPPTG